MSAAPGPNWLVALLLACAATGGAGERWVGAYYYPWYYGARWTNEPVTHTPQLGAYESADPRAAARHVAWAREAGLDFLLVSWLTPDGYENRNLERAVLPALEQGGLRFALLYETPLALGTAAGRPIDLDTPQAEGGTLGDRFVAHFDYLADRYLLHPAYLRIGGQSVIVIYLVRDLVHAGPYLQRVRERLAARGIAPYFIADAIYWAAPEQLDWPLLREHFQAVTAYNMYYRTNFTAAVRAQFRAAAQAAATNGLAFIPNVLPGYDDTPLRGMERVTINRRQGRFYDESWDVAGEFITDRQPFVLITSFNEWHEGTEIEPSTEYGSLYLEQTRRQADRLRGAAPDHPR